MNASRGSLLWHLRLRQSRHSSASGRWRRGRERSSKWSVIIARQLVALGVHALRIGYVVPLLKAVLIRPGRACAYDRASNRARGRSNGGARATAYRGSEPCAEYRRNDRRAHCVAVGTFRASRNLLAGKLGADALVLLKHFERFVGRGHYRHAWPNRLADAATEQHGERHSHGRGSNSGLVNLVQFPRRDWKLLHVAGPASTIPETATLRLLQFSMYYNNPSGLSLPDVSAMTAETWPLKRHSLAVTLCKCVPLLRAALMLQRLSAPPSPRS